MLKKNNYLLIGIFSLIISMVAISGCTSSTQNSNFTDGLISFQYPSDFQNMSAPADLFSGSGNWTNVVFLANSATTDISVSKNSNLISGNTPDTIGPATALAAKNQGESLLGSARMTNPNGVAMWKVTTT